MTASDLILEYSKFCSSFIVLSLGACAWIVSKEYEELQTPEKTLIWAHLVLILAFLANGFAAYHLVDLLSATFAQSALKESNFAAPDIKQAMRLSQYGMYAGAFLQALFLIMKFWKPKKKDVQVPPSVSTPAVALALFCLLYALSPKAAAKDGALAADFNFFGKEKDYKELSVSSKYTLKREAKIDPQITNIRKEEDGSFSVYNRAKKDWYVVPEKFCRDIASSQTNPGYDRLACIGITMKKLEDCRDPVNFTISISNSTPNASIYVDNYNWGKIDENGHFKQSLGAMCKNARVMMASKLSNCDEWQDEVRVDQDPYLYKTPIQLNCYNPKEKKKKKKS